MLQCPPGSTLFPYTTLFRSGMEVARPELDLLVVSENGYGKRTALSEYPRHHRGRSEEHTSELQSPDHLVCRLLLEKKQHIPRTPHKNQIIPHRAESVPTR